MVYVFEVELDVLTHAAFSIKSFLIPYMYNNHKNVQQKIKG